MNCFLQGLILALAVLSAACGKQDGHEQSGDTHEHADTHDDAEADKGPHGGRLLRQGNLVLEFAIVEDGHPARLQAWLSQDGKPVPSTAGEVEVILTRLGDVRESQRLHAVDDHFAGTDAIAEPHSFDVTVKARVGNTSAEWKFANYEGRTRIPDAIAERSGIRSAAVGPGIIRDSHEVQGLLTTIEGRHARLSARFPGPIRSVLVGVGENVSAGQTLATVESNVSMSGYAIASPIAGVVLARNASVGELAGDAPLFEVADLSALWVDLHLFGGDAQHITPGLSVVVTRLSDGVSASTTLDRILPGTATASQSTVARATLQNADGLWRPGAAVQARVTVAEDSVGLSVPLSAVQRSADEDVVFIHVGEDYEMRAIELGRRDSDNVEVLSGLESGMQVVIEQSYLVKADIEKAGAAHEH